MGEHADDAFDNILDDMDWEYDYLCDGDGDEISLYDDWLSSVIKRKSDE